MATIHSVETSGGWAHPTAHQGHDSGFGEWLEQARKARGLTLDDLSRETKIPVRNLEALEHGNLGGMPAFYQRAEVRAIARAVGVDERLAIRRLDTATTPPEESRVEREAEVAARPWWKPAALIAFVAVVAGIGWTADVGGVVLGWMAPRSEPAAAVAGSTAAVRPGVDPVVPAARSQPLALPPEPIVAGEPSTTVDPAAEVAPVASFTEIVVTTDPSGARVTVNGISWGVSPVTIRHLPPGAKRIRVTKDGFGAAEQLFALAGGQREALNLRLPAAP